VVEIEAVDPAGLLLGPRRQLAGDRHDRIVTVGHDQLASGLETEEEMMRDIGRQIGAKAFQEIASRLHVQPGRDHGRRVLDADRRPPGARPRAWRRSRRARRNRKSWGEPPIPCTKRSVEDTEPGMAPGCGIASAGADAVGRAPRSESSPPRHAGPSVHARSGAFLPGSASLFRLSSSAGGGSKP
jgi:hypothetical protein